MIKERVRKFLETDKDIAPHMHEHLQDSDSLFEKEVLDSLAIIKLISFIEKEFKIPIGPEDILQDNFTSLDSIGEFVLNKQKKV